MRIVWGPNGPGPFAKIRVRRIGVHKLRQPEKADDALFGNPYGVRQAPTFNWWTAFLRRRSHPRQDERGQIRSKHVRPGRS